MNRKWIVLIAALFALLVITGCSKKKAPAPAPAPMPAAPEPTPEPAPTPAPVDDVEKVQPASASDREADARNKGLLGDVFFDFDRDDLRPDARERLAKNAEYMNSSQGSDLDFVVGGHCDERGTNEYNLALGDRRANAAVEYLVSLGVAHGRFRAVSYGEDRPFCTQSTEACWQENRRAHFTVALQN